MDAQEDFTRSKTGFLSLWGVRIGAQGRLMTNEFADWLTSFRTALTFANETERKAVWENQVPKSFGTKLVQAEALFGPLEEWCQAQSQSIGGFAEDKAVQEAEVEGAAFQLAQALVTCFLDAENLTAAEPFRRGFSYWQLLRDADLLLRSQDVIDAATLLTTGAGAAAIADNYGISTAAVAALVATREDFADVASAPAAARAGRKGYSMLMRERFKPMRALFRDLDRLVMQFTPRPGGPQFVEGWEAARNVIATGGGGGGPVPPAIPLPTAPQNGSVGSGNPGSGEVSFSWQASPAAEQVTDYNVYRDGVLVATVQGPSATIGGLTSGEAVTLTVRAVNATGEGPGSEPVTGTAG